MNDTKKKLLKSATLTARTFHETMITLGYMLSDEERMELRRLIPLREGGCGC